MRSRLILLLSAILIWTSGSAVFSQDQVGSEFQVNSFAGQFQFRPAVAIDDGGNYVVIWQSEMQDGSGLGVYGQLYDSSGNRRGSEFRVNSYTTESQYQPAVGMDNEGNFVVVWTSYGQDGGTTGVFGSRFDKNGSPQGGEFRVNSHTPSDQYRPDVAVSGDGKFIVVWSSLFQDGDEFGVFGQRYAGNGNPLGPEFQVNSYTTYSQIWPSVGVNDDGDFVVSWTGSTEYRGGRNIFSQRFDANGNRLGDEFQVNTFEDFAERGSGVDVDSEGNFVVVWEAYNYTYSPIFSILGKRFANDGSVAGSEFEISIGSMPVKFTPQVDADRQGNFVVIWPEFEDNDQAKGRIFGKRFSSTNTETSGFQIDSYVVNDQPASVAVSDRGEMVVVWNRLDGSSNLNTLGQRYDIPASSASVKVQMDKGIYGLSENADVDVLYRAAPSPVVADAYVAININGSLSFVQSSGNVTNEVVPFQANKTITQDEVLSLLQDIPVALLGPGVYVWYAALTQPGTLNITGGISTFQVTVLASR